MSDLADAALGLAAEGWKVFPLNRDKRPKTANGFYDATTKPEVIKAWEWTEALIGAAVLPGQVIIDVDPRNGGSATLKLFREDGKTFPPTRIVRTRGGGFHYYFSIDEATTLRAKLGPGIDVKRAGKGYVVVPPSPGYALLADEPIAPAPEWLLEELVVSEAEAVGDGPSDAKFFPWEDGTPYGMAALEREVGRLLTAPEGDRNNSLNRAAFAMSQLAAGGEIGRKRAVKDLATAALRIGLDMKEAQATIASGWKAGEQVPRQARLRAEAVNIETFGQNTTEDTAGQKPTENSPGQAPTDPDNGEQRQTAAEKLAAARALADIAAAPGIDEEHFWDDWDIDEPPPPFYVWPLLPKNAYVWVYGATEASKSMVWMGLAAQGSHRGIKTSVYSLENPGITDRDRLRRWRPDKAHFRITHEPIDLNDPRQLAALVEREKEWADGRSTDLLILDTYSHAFNSRTEDGNAKAIEFARRCRWLMREIGCSVVVIDHTGYAQEDEPRDASAKRQQVDVAVLMKKAGEWRPGSPARFTMKNLKAGRFGNPFYLTGEIRDTKGDIRGLELGWLGESPKWEEA